MALVTKLKATYKTQCNMSEDVCKVLDTLCELLKIPSRSCVLQVCLLQLAYEKGIDLGDGPSELRDLVRRARGEPRQLTEAELKIRGITRPDEPLADDNAPPASPPISPNGKPAQEPTQHLPDSEEDV